MKPLLLILISGTLLTGRAQIPDLDEFTGDLDLELPTPASPTPAPASGLSRVHLFDAWEVVAALPEDATATVHLIVPEGTYLVSPNTERIASAYQRLAGEQNADWVFAAPLKVVLHADGNVSVAIRVKGEADRQLPPGLDLSPLPELKLAGKVVDIQVADRTHPLVMQAFTDIRRDALKAGWNLDRREFFFFPLEPGKVWFGLKVMAPSE